MNIQWEQGIYPSQIWGFLDLTDMPEGEVVHLSNDAVLERGVMAVVEVASVVQEEDPLSDIWTPINLEAKKISNAGEVEQRRYFLAPVEQFRDPICVIPNIGCKPGNQFLMMKHRDGWAQDFISWVRMPHEADKMEMREEPEEEEEESEEEEDSDSNSGDSEG